MDSPGEGENPRWRLVIGPIIPAVEFLHFDPREGAEMGKFFAFQITFVLNLI
jgi:hypothetical protein